MIYHFNKAIFYCNGGAGVGEVIKGWDVGVNGMRVGDKRRLTIPPQMAYGPEGVKGTIPGNAWLTFDVELVAVK
jgi:FK506-binding nuclear protein